MARCYKYSVLRVIPDPRRGECVNIGIVVFADAGADVRILPSLAKVSALNGQVDLSSLRELPKVLADWTNGASDAESAHGLLRNLGIVTVSALGSFEQRRQTDYELVISRLMRTLVSPVSAPRQPYGTRIKTELRTKFRRSNLLGNKGTAIAEHLVVEDYPIDTDEGLYADFALKNSTYHVTETADFRAPSISGVGLLRAASFAAIKLDKAKQSFGKSTKRYVVYAARKDAPSQPVNLLGEYSDCIFHIESRQDMASYMELIAAAASHTRSITTRDQ